MVGIGLGECDFEVGYRSGQTGQTVNLLAYAFVGSNPTPTMAPGAPTTPAGERVAQERKMLRGRDAGVAQLARASAFQAEGRGFESRLPLPAGRSFGAGRTGPEGGRTESHAPVAQWQSASLVRKRSRVQLPPGALRFTGREASWDRVADRNARSLIMRRIDERR